MKDDEIEDIDRHFNEYLRDTDLLEEDWTGGTIP